MITSALNTSPYSATQRQGGLVAFSGKRDVFKKAVKAVGEDPDRIVHFIYQGFSCLGQYLIYIDARERTLCAKLAFDAWETAHNLLRGRKVSSAKQPLNVVVHAGELMHLSYRGAKKAVKKIFKSKQ